MQIHLTHHGLIKVSGDQAKQFLQGQLTCNLEEISAEQSLLGAYCNYKGRILTDFRLFYYNNDYYLLVNKSLLAKTITQLKKYAVFSKVMIEDCTDLFVTMGYLGELPKKNPFSPIIIAVPGPQPRSEFIIKKQNFSNLDLHFDLTGFAANDRWQLENIMAGIPTIYPQTSEMFTPHMINYHLINGVSFNKGCFVGQEVITRTQHLGKLKRHMYRLQVTHHCRPQPGDPVFSQQQEIGTVIDASPDPQLQSGYQLLAVIHDEKFIQQGLSLIPTGAILSLQSLPYRV